MGVHGLWDLLAPVGRRVSVETLAGKKLAIDASIWMVQFMKAMRDEKGDMVRNAHLLGFFRRICKLLYLKTKPVFVFDGATPVLKRRTVIARRRQRENAQAKIRKTAEKLLINNLKTMKLKELEKDLENQRQRQKSDYKGKKIFLDMESNSEKSDAQSASDNKENRDEMLAASVAAEVSESLSKSASKSSTAGAFEEDGDEDEEIILPTMDENVDPAVLAALPPSMQEQILVWKNDAKGKKILSNELDQADMLGNNSVRNDAVPKSHGHEEFDEMLAASIVAEEDGNLITNASTSAASLSSDEEDGDEDEEMILPAMNGNVDPAVLAALPPSMQLDLLVQMRERLMAENRQEYQKVKKAPQKFSELQIQAYLKTVAFRREIDEVQKAAAGRGVGGVQTSRIASEANREFIFSSSFSGDKQVLTSSRVESKEDEQHIPSQSPYSDIMNNVTSIDKSDAETRSAPEALGKDFDDDVETYLDERGRVRVSRVRAMGIRMTRDLQRNLDMMKEIEHDGPNRNEIANAQSVLNLNKTGTPKGFSRKDKFLETSHDGNSESVKSMEKNEQPIFKIENSIEISFEDKCDDDDDDIFARLAAGNTVIFPAQNCSARKQSSDSMSDSDWEEGIIKEKGNSFSNDVNAGIKPPLNLNKCDVSDESDVEWEEGLSGAPKSSSAFRATSEKPVSKGYREEEANLQEAIRRSLLDQCGEKPNYLLSELEKSKNVGEDAHDDIGFHDKMGNMGDPNLLGKNATHQNKLYCESVDGLEKLDTVGVNNSLVIDSLGSQLKLSAANSSNAREIQINESCKKYVGSPSEESRPDGSDGRSLCRDASHAESDTTMELKHIQVVQGQHSSVLGEDDGHFTHAKKCSQYSSQDGDVIFGDASNSILVDGKKNDCESKVSILPDDKINELESSIMIDEKKCDSLAEPLFHAIRTTDPSVSEVESASNASMYDIDIEQKLTAEKARDSYFKSREHNMEKSAIKANENVLVDMTDAILEEMLILDQECANLGNEQKKLEQNAESVSSEMFAECQELLQMFGLPYIIAPMEAEAQCGYMELANLVDGVVTDDSDVFLFGARSVYKNIFDDRKYVETYFMQDIEKELGLSREKLIRMALLLGSDYTEGISGIGIVNAIEVVNAFPEEDGLFKFREWIESPDLTILGKLGVQTSSNSRKRQSKNSGNDVEHKKQNMEGVSEFDKDIFQSDENKKIFMDKHRNVSKNWHIPSSFPSEEVISAYSCPQVDKSTEPCSWGKPDLFVLRKFCWDKFGWGSDKSNELLLPVLKEYEKHETQLRLEAFYTFNERFAKIRSKRIKEAVKGITRSQSLMDDAEQVPKSRKKRRIDCLESGNDQSQKASKEAEENVAGTRNNNVEKSTPRQSRKRKVAEKFASSRMENPERLTQADRGRNANKVSRGTRRGKDQRAGWGKERGKLCAEPSETSSSGGIGGDDKEEFCAEVIEGPQEVRRSTRSRKSVNYSVNDPEIDDVGKILNNKEVVEQDFAVHGACGDASAAPGRKKQQKANDPSLEENPCRDCLESGGGFCIEEGENGQSSASPNGDPFLEAETSNDYLKMGGGFCVDESVTFEDQVVAQDTVVTGENPSSCFDFTDRVDCDIGLGDPTSGSKGAISGAQNGERINTCGAVPNMVHENATSTTNVKNNDDDVSGGALTVMPSPFLRRKRRRS